MTRNGEEAEISDNFVGGINLKVWSLKRLSDHNWKVVKFKGKSAIKITVHRGDYQMIGNDGKFTERVELSEKKSIWHAAMLPIWYSFEFYFPKTFKIVDNRLVFAQWKQSTKEPESPFVSFRYINGDLIYQVVFERKSKKFICKKREWRGNWHKVLVYYRLQTNQLGETKAWVDGKMVADYKGKMASSHPTSNPHFKMGLYRDQTDIPQTIYLTNFRRTSRSVKIPS